MVFLCAVPAAPNEPLPMDATSILTDDLVNVTYFVDAAGRTMQTPASFENLFYRDLAPADAAWAIRRLRPQGGRPLVEPWPLEAWPDVPRTVVLAKDDNVVRFEAGRAAALALTGEEPIVVPGGHSVFLSDPKASRPSCCPSPDQRRRAGSNVERASVDRLRISPWRADGYGGTVPRTSGPFARSA